MVYHIIHPIPLVKSVGVSTYKMSHLVGTGSPQNRGSYVWYIEGPKEKIIVDAGSSVEFPATGGAGTIMFPEGHAEHIQTVEEGLAKFDEVKILTMPDHCTPLSTRTHSAEPVPFSVRTLRRASSYPL